MKNLIAMLLALVLAVTLPLTALAEGTTPADLENSESPVDMEPDPYAATLNGLVVGWTEEGAILIRGEYGQMYQVEIDPEYTNMMDAQFLMLGDYVTVLYDGMLSRSIPAKLTASYISCFQRTGVVTELDYDEEADRVAGFLMTDGDEQLYVALDEANDQPVNVGTTVTVYFDGMMSRSIPAQINALYLRTIHLAGQLLEIGEAEEDGSYALLMKDDVYGEVLVRCDADTILYARLNVGEMITVATSGMMTMSLPAQTYALEVMSMAVPAR